MVEEQQNIEKTERKSKKKRIFLLLLLILLLCIAVAGIFYYLSLTKSGKTGVSSNTTAGKAFAKPKLPPELRDLEKPGIFVSLGDFVVNLADTDVQRFAKVSIIIEVVDENVQSEVNQYLPALRDAVVNLISSKYYSDIRTPEGRERLKIELLKRFNAILPEGGVKAVYFTSFVVQSI
jgi:flagellar FliL protein